MARNWSGDLRRDLLTLGWDEFHKRHPEVPKGTYKSQRSYWRKQAPIEIPKKKGEVMEAEGRLVKSWEVAMRGQDGEWDTTTLRSYEHTPDPEALGEVFEPAAPARITPTRRKRATELGKKILVFGDSQIGYHRVYDQDGNDSLIPIHSEEALSVICQINAEERPHTIVNLSDTVDMGELSRFQPGSDGFHRTLGPSFQRAHDLYAQLRADNPDARIVETDSNHTARAQKRMMERYPEWYGFVLPGEDYPMMSYYRLANLAHVQVEFISGYGAAEFVYGEEYDKPPIVFKHGTHSSSSPGTTVKKEAAQNPTVHVVRGHGHSYEHIAQTTRDGDTLHYIQLGTTCQTNGNVPSYHSAMDDFGHPVRTQENWQNQAMMITDYEGQYQFDVIDIVRGIAYYRNKLYIGREDGNE